MSGTTTRRAIGQSVSFGPKLRTALNDVLGGGAASVLTVTFGLSYSLLIFAGPLAPYLSYGVAATFIASAILAFRHRTRKLAAVRGRRSRELHRSGDGNIGLLAGRTNGLGWHPRSGDCAGSDYTRPFNHYHRPRALRLRGDADGPRDPLRALPRGRRISRRGRLPAASRRDSRHHGGTTSTCDTRPVRKYADAVRTGGSLRDGPRPLSDLAPLPQHVRTAGYPYRRHRLRARCALVCRHLTGRRASRRLDL